jgi:hypothetical protein
VKAYAGDRQNRRHKPGRALERIDYRFDVLSDYAGFRDLQRHRLLTIDWQDLSPEHGYDVPDTIEDAGLTDRYHSALERSGALYDAMAPVVPRQAPYAVAMAYRVRYSMQFNAREAMHLIELRSQPQGHPNYRRVVQDMYRLIKDKAGHHAVAEMLVHVDMSSDEDGRLDAERRLDAKRSVEV